FGTAGTGGFGVLNSSVASYSVYSQIVITIFMVLFGVNFSIYYLLICGRLKDALKSEELRVYLGIYLSFSLLIAYNIHTIYQSVSQCVLLSFFQVGSIMTTTGFSTANFAAWPELSRYLLLLLMCIGACAGSTGGGIKISRMCLLFKTAHHEIHKLLHPRSVSVVRFEKKRMDDGIVKTAHVYLMLYIMIIGISVLVVSFDEYDFTSNFSAVLATFNNIGPGLSRVGPLGNYSLYSALSKLVLIIDMLLGRLEIFPILLLFDPSLLKKYRIRKKAGADE
ncbi:MAG: TrkH family potassium uptake protein, partial [Clostridia bacterium]|nr:TrkH family potassium uptake protein [Clostridia bacterium]